MGAHEVTSLRQIHEIELGAVTQRYELVADAHRTLSERHAQLRIELQQLHQQQASDANMRPAVPDDPGLGNTRLCPM
jgi:hypothetical protein